MPDRMTIVARALNEVKSVGQARAALHAAADEATRGFALADYLSDYSTPTPDQARDTLTVLRTAVDTELRQLEARPETAAVDPAAWPRTRRAAERVYNETAGIEGVIGGLDRVDVGNILLDSIRDAPRVFLRATGEVVGEVGRAAGSGVGGLFSGLGFVGVVFLLVVAAAIFGARRI